MSFEVFAAVVLAGFFLWGLVSPRSQWRVLVAWTRRFPDASEPGSTAYALYRAVSGVGVAAFATVGIVLGINFVNSLPPDEPPKTALQQMWGSAPDPRVVDRIVRSSPEVDPALVSAEILGYQEVDNVRHTPRYLVYLNTYSGPATEDTLIGISPGSGFAALDSAEMVVNVRVKPQCAPLQATVIETEEVVQVAIYVGVPVPVGASAVDHSFCAGTSLVGPSLLIPLDLQAPLGERQLQTLDGTAIAEVPLAE